MTAPHLDLVPIPVRDRFLATFGEPLTARSLVRALLDPGFRATLNLAVQLWCSRHRSLKLAALWLRLHNVRAYGIDVEVGATIGPGLRIRHPRGIVIHHAARIGAGVAIQQGVTLGIRWLGEGPEGGSPLVGDHVTICAGATLLGHIVVGDGAVIGAHAVVLSSVPAGATVVGAPAHPVRADRRQLR